MLQIITQKGEYQDMGILPEKGEASKQDHDQEIRILEAFQWPRNFLRSSWLMLRDGKIDRAWRKGVHFDKYFTEEQLGIARE